MSSTLLEYDILQRVIDPKEGGLPPELARYVLSWQFSPADRARVAELSDKAQAGTLTPAEHDELNGYLNVNDFLSIIRMKAERSLSNAEK
jgi:hypothetical protein